MACPYFLPAERFDDRQWPNPPILPLGDPYRGVCAAGGGCHMPDEESLRDLCNQGYARNRCSRFPEREGPDAVRFLTVADTGKRVRIAYVLERDHHPWEHGVLEYSVAMGDCAYPHPVIDSLAKAYLTSYLRRSRGSGGSGAS
ncbi:MAG: hypothetical protein WD696_02350 [Bryobacteraceae bacterium]